MFSCARIKLKKWLLKTEDLFFDEVDYRHVVLTVPKKLRIYFYNNQEKLPKLIKYRKRIKEMTGKTPLICENCGAKNRIKWQTLIFYFILFFENLK